MKKLLLSATVVAGLFAAPTVSSLQQQINDLQKQLKELKADQTKQNDRYYKKVAPVVTNTHLFWSFDLRSTFDFIEKETTGGAGGSFSPNIGQFSPIFLDQTLTPQINAIIAPKSITMNGINNSQFVMQPSQNNADKYIGRIFSNRVILTGVYKPSDKLKATVRIEANKVFGSSNINSMQEPFQNFDWVANETPDDDSIRLKEAFFNYYFGDDLMFSAGRRPATNGFPANLREGDDAASPLAHLINMEFDGFSFEIGNGEFANISDLFSDWGTWMKFCAGRGFSNTNGKWSFTSNSDYTADKDARDADFAGFILVPYDNGQYSVKTETVWAFNLMGFMPTGEVAVYDGDGDSNLSTGQAYQKWGYGYSMQTVGNYFGENIVFAADGIGDGISDFLDGTKAFVSYAFSQTRPKAGQRMLGSTDKKTGHSIWVGADMPGIGDNDRFGVNYVRGSEYWRNFTYGEDTLAGSIAAVRGHAIDVYYNKEIIPHLTAGLRYTYISYDNPGSDGFFGDFGNPSTTMQTSMGTMPVDYVKTAKDIRVSIRYRF
jgi:hypothetical protein